jgi:hypothetical protein
VYLNEAAVTENRIGLYTEIKPQGVQPKLGLVIQPVLFTEKVEITPVEITSVKAQAIDYKA